MKVGKVARELNRSEVELMKFCVRVCAEREREQRLSSLSVAQESIFSRVSLLSYTHARPTIIMTSPIVVNQDQLHEILSTSRSKIYFYGYS